jgi:hypothetical protein
MIGTIIGLILLLVFLGVLFWGGQQLLALVPMSEPFSTIIRVLIAILMVVIVIYVLIVLLGMAGIHVPMLSGLK